MRANQATFAARAWPINRARHQKARQKAYDQGAAVVDRLQSNNEQRELALAMLYLGDGSKTGGAVRLGSVNPEIMAYFVSALRSLYQVDETRLSCRLHLINAARDQEWAFIRWWSEKINVNVSQFGPSAYDRRSKATHITDDYRGVCVVTYCDTYILQRILGLARTYIRIYPNHAE